MAREAEAHFALEGDLRRALVSDELVVYYQPKFSLQSWCLVGFEALIRWQHPEKGLLGPHQFLSVAHDAGLMPELTEYVIRHVCRQVRSWKELDMIRGPVSINLDGQTLSTPEVSHHLQRMVRDEGITPEEVELEITETVILEQGHHPGPWTELVDVGFLLSIDDFGTGESSLFRLKHLPVQTLKIDRSFVMDIDEDKGARTIIRSIVEMAKSLGKRVLAEGVENAFQLDYLSHIGCEEVQGYYIAKPMPADRATAFLGEFSAEALLRPSSEGRMPDELSRGGPSANLK
jgi:EAL domain-containing protein (putative c-di-GMP-specific phosphodiesterase class I)